VERPDAALDRERRRGKLAGVGIDARHGDLNAEGTGSLGVVGWVRTARTAARYM
jgi:hypothetical protein